MAEKNSKKILFTVSNELYEKIKSEAEKENRSMSNLLGTILKNFFEKQKEKKDN